NLEGKSTPKVPQLVIELQNRPQTAKPDIRRPLTNQNRSQRVLRWF
ncbi:Os01g0282251, partial [Oryza sativa Japonica Group]